MDMDPAISREHPQLLETQTAEEQFLSVQDTNGRVRVRVQAQLYNPAGRYQQWRGVSWRLQLPAQVVDAAALRAALGMFFQAVTVAGPEQVTHVLQQAATVDMLPLSRLEVVSDSEEES